MKWLMAGLILGGVGITLRRLLRLDVRRSQSAGRLPPLSEDRAAIYQPVVREIETQSAILGISLNDAFEERDAGNSEIAWRLVRLSVSEWDRLTEIVTLLLRQMTKYLPSAKIVVPTRTMGASHFRSRAMVDYVRMHELLDQLVFQSRLRFQLHLRVLRRAVETLSAEFRRSYRYAERTGDRPPELWTRFDHYFHDLDLVSKETLLALRALLACLPHSTLPAFGADLQPILHRGVRATAASPGD
jgi:hypothetical protein